MSAHKKVFIKTYGCQMNVYDSNRMLDSLEQLGFEKTDAIELADMVILNTCHIREKATEKVYSEIGRIRKFKDRKNPGHDGVLIGVAGCVAQAEGEEIVARAPAVDLVFGPQSYHRLPELIERVSKGESVVETEFPVEDKFDRLPMASKEATRTRGITAFLTVQEGCDKFCTFCVVPYTRGAEMSRPVMQIVAEAERLVGHGVREITLLGQNVNAYHGLGLDKKTWGLGRLLRRLAEIPGLDRLRYTTSHPSDMDTELIEAHRDLDKLMPYLHLPVQSGSNRILAAMNRRHTREEYFELVERIRDARPDMALSGDFIVGFPGETDQDFEETLDLVDTVRFGSAYSFKYSPRPGTPGAQMDDQVPDDLKSERLTRLQTVLATHQKAFNESKVGVEMDVLLEKAGRHKGQLSGRSPWLQAVHLQAPKTMLGSVQRVYINGIGNNSLSGKLVTSAQEAYGDSISELVTGGAI